MAQRDYPGALITDTDGLLANVNRLLERNRLDHERLIQTLRNVPAVLQHAVDDDLNVQEDELRALRNDLNEAATAVDKLLKHNRDASGKISAAAGHLQEESEIVKKNKFGEGVADLLTVLNNERHIIESNPDVTLAFLSVVPVDIFIMVFKNLPPERQEALLGWGKPSETHG